MEVEDFTQEQKQALKDLGVMAVYLFGSVARDDMHPLSDVDFGVLFENPDRYEGETLDVYTELYKIFNEILPSDYLQDRFERREHEFDVVFMQFAPIQLQFNIIKDGQILFEANKEERLNYKEYIMKKNADMQHYYKMFRKNLFERIG
jgi:predicted nucleotidyltransferase